MRIVSNAGTDRLFDLLRSSIRESRRLDLATDTLSLFAFAALRETLSGLDGARMILPSADADLSLYGSEEDRSLRNGLQARWLAGQCAAWVEGQLDLRRAPGHVPQGIAVARASDGTPSQTVIGSFSLSTAGLGLTPGNPLSLIQASETAEQSAQLAGWFDTQWGMHRPDAGAQAELVASLRARAAHRAPLDVYALVLDALFGERDDAMDEDRIVKAATGIRDTAVWNKLYAFQRDGVVAAIDKLNRYGGCILADSVGLGKTFEALAVIKYHELRNDRVLVLCPKRLRDNWTLYAANDRRNALARDRFNYDVLNHTDLSRGDGLSGDIDLSGINWGNYDLVVIDESHNFRNKKTPRAGFETRYDRLMRQIVKEGVRTRVLMLSATPVNNRLADLRNQIAFATEGDDQALAAHGIESVDTTTRHAQKQFNQWLELPEAQKTTGRLVEMLGFDYFTLLDRLTIARSRRHVETYYGTDETGRFPERLKPINLRPDVDLDGAFPPIATINAEIRRLKLAAYTPLQYVYQHKREAYDAKYSTKVKGGARLFHQADREQSLINLMRIGLLKRMESSVSSFELTVGRQLAGVNDMLARVESAAGETVDELEIDDVDIDDPAFETLLVGKRVKVLMTDVDLVRWRQDLEEDRGRLETLRSAAADVGPERDAKLAALRDAIEAKCREPINGGNRKAIVFTAFADTAEYLYKALAPWARETLGLESALVTGSGGNQTTLAGISRRLGSILSAFAPRSKERPDDMAGEGEIDLLFATDCISEGQNLQDCDWLVNYDIHWNPVRIIQRFGRVDRLGSPNDRIQLVNFWPNMELEEYINLEERVSGRMTLLDVSATGEENIIERQSGDPMNDLAYRRQQMVQMQDAVMDLEDLSTGVSITDLTLTDLRIDLARFLAAHPDGLDDAPPGLFAVTTTADADVPPGTLFCLRAEGDAAERLAPPGYPLAPLYLVHVADDGSVSLPYTQAKQILDRMKRLSLGRALPDAEACARFDRATKGGEDMQTVQRHLAAAVASIVGKTEERSVASLFSPGGTHALAGEFAGTDDFEVVAFLVVLPEGGR